MFKFFPGKVPKKPDGDCIESGVNRNLLPWGTMKFIQLPVHIQLVKNYKLMYFCHLQISSGHLL